MSTHPGFYFEIGKKARDLLYKDYVQESPSHSDSQSFNWSFRLSYQKDLFPGFQTAFRFAIPYSSKVELRYLHDYGGITAGVGLSRKPTLSFSTLGGVGRTSAASEVVFSTASQMFTRCNVGINFSGDFLIASFMLNDMGHTLKASCYSMLNPLTNTAVATELAHSFLDNSTYLTIGTQHLLFPSTLVKARASTYGRIGAMIQQELLPAFFLALAGEMEFKSTERGAKVGLTVAFRP